MTTVLPQSPVVPVRAAVWDARLEAGLRAGGIAISTFALVVALARAFSQPMPGGGLLSMALGLTGFAIALGDALRRPRLLGTGGAEALIPLLSLGCATAAAVVAHRVWPDPPHGTFLMSVTGICALYAVLVLGVRRAVVPLLIAYGISALADGSFSSDPVIAARSHAELVAQFAFVAVAVGIARAIVVSLEAGRGAIAVAQQASGLRRSAERAGSAVREVESFVHDEVLHLLRSLRLVSRRSDLRRLQGEAGELSDRIRSPRDLRAADGPEAPLADLVTELAEVVRASPVRVGMRAGGRVLAPTALARAVCAGVREGLRNVDQHSGTDFATLSVRRSRAGFEVTLRDDGVGFEPENVPLGHFGLARSVREGVERAGGRVRIDSSPGAGTALTLSWEPGAVAPHVVSALTDRVCRAFALAVVPGVVAMAPLMVLRAGELAQPVLAILGTVVVLVALAVIAPSAVRLGLTRARGQILCWTAVASTAANGLALGPGSAVPDYWASGGAAGVMALVLFLRPVREVVLPAFLVMVIPPILLAPQVNDAEGLFLLVPALTTPTTAIICAVLIRRLVRSYGQVVATTMDAEVLAAEGARTAEADLNAGLRRLDELEATLCPVLDAVSEGRLDPRDPKVGADLSALEAALRRDLDLARLPRTRAVVNRAVDRGWTVQARVADPGRTGSGSGDGADTERGMAGTTGMAGMAAVDDVLGAGLEALLERDDPAVDLALSVLSDGPTWRLGLVVRPGIPAQGEALTRLDAGWVAVVHGPVLRITCAVGGPDRTLEG